MIRTHINQKFREKYARKKYTSFGLNFTDSYILSYDNILKILQDQMLLLNATQHALMEVPL